MDGKHPENIDPRPKRRKDPGNPYTIFSTGADSESTESHYYVSFRDGQGKYHCLEISEELFREFDRFELDDLSFLNEVDNHYEHSELTEVSLYNRASQPPEELEESIFRSMDGAWLHAAVDALPEVQRRRVRLYYFEGHTYQEIAALEGCTKMAVKFSVETALKNLKKEK